MKEGKKMKITNVTIKKVNDESNLKGYVTVVLEDCFAIHNLKIVNGLNGLFIAFPSQKGTNDKYYDICHPITQNFREMLTDEILKEYNK